MATGIQPVSRGWIGLDAERAEVKLLSAKLMTKYNTKNRKITNKRASLRMCKVLALRLWQGFSPRLIITFQTSDTIHPIYSLITTTSLSWPHTASDSGSPQYRHLLIFNGERREPKLSLFRLFRFSRNLHELLNSRSTFMKPKDSKVVFGDAIQLVNLPPIPFFFH